MYIHLYWFHILISNPKMIETDLVTILVGFYCSIIFWELLLPTTGIVFFRQTQALAEPMIATLLASSEHIDKNMVRTNQQWPQNVCEWSVSRSGLELRFYPHIYIYIHTQNISICRYIPNKLGAGWS